MCREFDFFVFWESNRPVVRRLILQFIYQIAAVLFVVVAMFVWTVGDAGPYEMDILLSSNCRRIANKMATQVVANYSFSNA